MLASQAQSLELCTSSNDVGVRGVGSQRTTGKREGEGGRGGGGERVGVHELKGHWKTNKHMCHFKLICYFAAIRTLLDKQNLRNSMNEKKTQKRCKISEALNSPFDHNTDVPPYMHSGSRFKARSKSTNMFIHQGFFIVLQGKNKHRHVRLYTHAGWKSVYGSYQNSYQPRKQNPTTGLILKALLKWFLWFCFISTHPQPTDCMRTLPSQQESVLGYLWQIKTLSIFVSRTVSAIAHIMFPFPYSHQRTGERCVISQRTFPRYQICTKATNRPLVCSAFPPKAPAQAHTSCWKCHRRAT